MSIKKGKFNVDDRVVIEGNPDDEQLGQIANNTQIHIVTEIKDVSHLKGSSGQWIKTNIRNSDWTDSGWFVKSLK